MTEDQIKYMVDRFLGWRLPKNFNPDCGISFDRKYQDDHSPTGTNIFDAAQTHAMVRYMVEGVPLSPSRVAELRAYYNDLLALQDQTETVPLAKALDAVGFALELLDKP